MFKNTIKLLINNFSLVWKILLYKIIVFMCVLGLTIIVSLPIISELIRENFFVHLQSTLQGLFFNVNIGSVFATFGDTFIEFWTILSSANLITLTIVVGTLLIIVYYFVNGLYHLAVVDNLHGYMGSMIKYGFMNSYISNFGKSITLQLSQILIGLMLDIAIIIGGVLIYVGMMSTMTAIISPLVVIAYFLILFSLKTTFFAGVKSAIIIHNCGVFTAYSKNFKAIGKKFFVILSNCLILMLLIMFTNMFAVLFTLGVGLIITLPITSLVLLTFKNVVYYDCTGMRYYSDMETIVSPKRLEEQDKFNKVKNII